MTEKRVSVRLAVVGGREVRAELEGIGEAGNHAFGRLGREMESANARLAAFSRRVTIAMTAAVTAAAAAGVGLVRSGLAAVDAQGKLARSLGTTVASIGVLERAGELAGVAMSGIEQTTGELTRRLGEAADGAGPAAAALARLGLSATELLALPLDERVESDQRGDRRLRACGRARRRRRRGLRREGRGRHGAARHRDAAPGYPGRARLRPRGLGDRRRAHRARQCRGLPARAGLARAREPARRRCGAGAGAGGERHAPEFARTTGPVGIAIHGLFDNLGRLAAYAATFAGIMAGRSVAGLVAAAVSVRSLATALVVLRGALIRTGIGALLVGAGELVYQFGRLVAGAGGFGNAMSLLGDVAAEVWERIKAGGASLALSLQSVWARIEAGWLKTLSGIQRSWADFLHAVTNGLDAVPGMEEATLGLSEAAIRAGSAFYETAAAAGEASARADDLAASAAAAASAATAPLRSLEALRDAMATAAAETETAQPTPAGVPGAADGSSAGVGGRLRGMADALDTAKQAAGGAADAIGEVDDRTTELATTLQSNVAQGLGSLFTGLISGATSLRDALGSVISRLGELALTKGFETLLAGAGFGNGPLGQLASFLLPTPRASGGPVAAGMPYLVGERGPELIVPRAPGRVIPNHALGSSSAQGTPVAITVQVTGARGNAEIRQMVEAGVAQGLRAYDARLADRVARIGADPRFRG
ncbi:MAG: phage tail tape measure protein [Amaricoccus sp.]